MAEKNNGSVIGAMIWMFIISLLLFWLPIVGPLVAGFVGGKKAGGVGAAVVAVFLPAILIGGGLFLIAAALTGFPLIGALAGVGGFALAVGHIGPLLLGAIAGGLLA